VVAARAGLTGHIAVAGSTMMPYRNAVFTAGCFSVAPTAAAGRAVLPGLGAGGQVRGSRPGRCIKAVLGHKDRALRQLLWIKPDK